MSTNTMLTELPPRETTIDMSPPVQIEAISTYPDSTATSHLIEGMDLSFAVKIWVNLAASESRLQIMTELKKLNIGFAEVEEFNLGLNLKFRSKAFKENSELNEGKVIREAMSLKMRDETKWSSELTKERNVTRSFLEEKFGKNTRKSRKILKILKSEAQKTRQEYSRKFNSKYSHLKGKYKETENEKLDKVPKNLEEYESLSIFDKEKFDSIETENYEVAIVGDISLTHEEKKVLQLHPKFSVMQCLSKSEMRYELELAFAKLRYEIGRENNERI